MRCDIEYLCDLGMISSMRDPKTSTHEQAAVSEAADSAHLPAVPTEALAQALQNFILHATACHAIRVALNSLQVQSRDCDQLKSLTALQQRLGDTYLPEKIEKLPVTPPAQETLAEKIVKARQIQDESERAQTLLRLGLNLKEKDPKAAIALVVEIAAARLKQEIEGDRLIDEILRTLRSNFPIQPIVQEVSEKFSVTERKQFWRGLCEFRSLDSYFEFGVFEKARELLMSSETGTAADFENLMLLEYSDRLTFSKKLNLISQLSLGEARALAYCGVAHELKPGARLQHLATNAYAEWKEVEGNVGLDIQLAECQLRAGFRDRARETVDRLVSRSPRKGILGRDEVESTVSLLCRLGDFDAAERVASSHPEKKCRARCLTDVLVASSARDIREKLALCRKIEKDLFQITYELDFDSAVDAYIAARIEVTGRGISAKLLERAVGHSVRIDRFSSTRDPALRYLKKEAESFLELGQEEKALLKMEQIAQRMAESKIVPPALAIDHLGSLFLMAQRRNLRTVGARLLPYVESAFRSVGQVEKRPYHSGDIVEQYSKWRRFDVVERLLTALPIVADEISVRDRVIPALGMQKDVDRYIKVSRLEGMWARLRGIGNILGFHLTAGRTAETRKILAAAISDARVLPPVERAESFRTLAWHAHQFGFKELSARLVKRVVGILPGLPSDEFTSIHSQLIYFHSRQSTRGVEETIALVASAQKRCDLLLEFIPKRCSEEGRQAGKRLLLEAEAQCKSNIPERNARCEVYRALSVAAAELGERPLARRYLRAACALLSTTDCQVEHFARVAAQAVELGMKPLVGRMVNKAMELRNAGNWSAGWGDLVKLAVESGDNASLKLLLSHPRLELRAKLAESIAGAVVTQSKEWGSEALPNARILKRVDHHQSREVWEAVGTMLNAASIEAAIAETGEQAEMCAAVSDLSAALTHGPSCGENGELLLARARGHMQKILARNSPADSRLLAMRIESIAALGTNQSNQALTEFFRSGFAQESVHKGRLLEGLAKTGTHRAHDLMLDAVREGTVDWRLGRRMVSVLAEREYLDRSLKSWLNAQRKARRELPFTEQRAGEREDYFLLRKLLVRGIVPSREIIVHLSRNSWTDADGKALATVDEKLDSLKRYEEEFARHPDSQSLIAYLAKKPQAAFAFYVLHNGEARFSLINNYSMHKFKALLEDAAGLQIHRAPLDEFSAALEASGLSKPKAREVLIRLESGLPPTEASPDRILRLDVSDNLKLEAAHREAAFVLGSHQLGVCLKAPLYRSYLGESRDSSAGSLIEKLARATTLQSRFEALEEMERADPSLRHRAIEELSANWKKLGEKLALGTTLENLLDQEENPVSCADIVKQIERHRLTLRDSHASLLTALRGENPQLRKISEEIRRKGRAMQSLEGGMAINPRLLAQVEGLREDIRGLEKERDTLSAKLVGSRYAELSREDRERRIQEEASKLRALADKDAAAVFIYVVMSIVGEDRLTEGDCELIKEVSSHLSGPLQIAREMASSERGDAALTKPKLIRLHYLNKREDLMTLARFADSKICCFSSSNYDIKVAHNVPNRVWLASILKDPLSFVIEFEEADSRDQAASDVALNVGFVFGSFAVSDGKPGVLLNGIYLAQGADATSAASILNSIEESFSAPLALQWQFCGSCHGGSIGKGVPGYSVRTFEAKRLRALANWKGQPETRIYDDLGEEVNTEIAYSGLFRMIEAIAKSATA